MRKTLIVSGALALAASTLPAQTVRWNDRPTATWADEAPRVRLYIDGPRAVGYGTPMSIRFEVSENAYVTVARVDDDGRLTILFPHSRNQRAAARGGMMHYVRNPRLGGNFAFIANDRMSGYIFAIASYAPLDFSTFENRDYNNIGGWSRFTLANRSIARRPDVFIDRFAATVLWDSDTPYDYDVDYYHPIGYAGAFNTLAMCHASGFSRFVGWRTYMAQFSSWDRVAYPFYFNSMCGDFYYRLRCYSSLALYSHASCAVPGRVTVVSQPTGGLPGQPVDTAFVPNEGVVRGGLFAPTPVPVDAGPDAPPQERAVGRFDQSFAGGDFDNIMSIPPRATRKMKEDDARRERAADDAATGRADFDRSDASAKKPEKSTANGDAATRTQPPPREPTRVKAVEPRRETASKGGFGSPSRTSGPRSTGPDRVTRPAQPKSSAGSGSNPPSIQGTTTEKKKPPKS